MARSSPAEPPKKPSTAESAPPPSTAESAPPPYREIIVTRARQPQTVDEKEADTRAVLAYITLIILGGTLLFAFTLVGLKRSTVDEMLKFLQPIIPAEVGLAGSAVAFYFGNRRRDN